jgi:cytochrome c oxidase cbb3-type subunit 3
MESRDKPLGSAVSDQTEAPITDHNYDGILEYDNPMPGWWLWIFWLTVVFGVVYVLGIHVFGFVNTYQDDLDQSLAELQQVRDEYTATHGTFEADAVVLQSYADEPSHVEAGSTIFTTNCSMCHGDKGQGLIGPNLTDEYWIHGGGLTDIFTTVTQGVIEKGMTPWDGILTAEQRAQVTAFVASIQGTNPSGAKEPQGELYRPEEAS